MRQDPNKNESIRLSRNCQLGAEMLCSKFFDWIKLNFNDPCGESGSLQQQWIEQTMH